MLLDGCSKGLATLLWFNLLISSFTIPNVNLWEIHLAQVEFTQGKAIFVLAPSSRITNTIGILHFSKEQSVHFFSK